MWTSRALVLPVLLAFAAGCGSDGAQTGGAAGGGGGSGGSGSSGGSGGASCNAHADCGAGERCSARGVCVSTSGGGGATDGGGAGADGGGGTGGAGACTADADCQAATPRCRDGRCQAATVGEIGMPCSAPAECAFVVESGAGFCAPFPGGYCSAPCGAGGAGGAGGAAACPAGSVCTASEGRQACLASCRTGADCRDGRDYVCRAGTCALHCRHLACGVGEQCNETTGDCAPIARTAAAGSDCGDEHGNCQAGLLCRGDPQAYRCFTGCNPTQRTFCATSNALCEPFGSETDGLCLEGGTLADGASCAEHPLDCRTGSVCVGSGNGDAVECLRACDPDGGAPRCTGRTACAGVIDANEDPLPWGVCVPD